MTLCQSQDTTNLEPLSNNPPKETLGHQKEERNQPLCVKEKNIARPQEPARAPDLLLLSSQVMLEPSGIPFRKGTAELVTCRILALKTLRPLSPSWKRAGLVAPGDRKSREAAF